MSDAPATQSANPPSVPDPAPAPAQQSGPPRDTGMRRPALIVLGLFVVLFALSVLMERNTPQSGQARVQAYVVPMAAEIAGRVAEVAVLDNAPVRAGETLFRIDPRPYEIAVAEAEAKLARVGQSLRASTSAIDVSMARVVEARAQRDNVREQAQRAMQLVQRGVYARARYDEAKAALDSSQAAVAGAEADLERARSELGPAGDDNPQLREAMAALERARLDLQHTTVVAPSDGVVTNLQLATGQVVAAGKAALTFIAADTIWVSAAFKENSLEHVAPGNRAEVVLDSRPGAVFAARVESVAWGVASGDSADGGLPTVRNDSGWVRDPQRFPVRLVFAGTPPRGVRYGSQVNVVIYTGDNPVLNVLGTLWIRLIALLTYVG